MLRDLPEISVRSIQDYTGYSLSYAKKLATLLRIAATAFEKVLTEGCSFDSDGDPFEDDLSRYDLSWDDNHDLSTSLVRNKAHLYKVPHGATNDFLSD
ncbi:hypothetical protein B0920_14675 [Massilia sp. KIM]|nr:hypothetical protein B0920_14675 [Massilia sp. KIM]